MKSSTPVLTAKRDTPPTRKAQTFFSQPFSLYMGPGWLLLTRASLLYNKKT